MSPEDRERLWTEEVDIAASRNEVDLAIGDRQGERDNSGKQRKDKRVIAAGVEVVEGVVSGVANRET